MAAKKSAKKKSKVTVEIDMAVLMKLVDAAEALSEMAAAATIQASDDPKVRARMKKKGRR